MWSVVMLSELTWFMWSYFVLLWSEVRHGEVLADKSVMYIRVTVLFITFIQYPSGFILYHCIYGCMFCVLLFNCVNYVYLLLCYIFLLLCIFIIVMCSFVSLNILILCMFRSVYCLCVNVYCITATVGRDSSVGIATPYGLDSPGIESLWRRDPAPFQTWPGAHPASYTIGT
jgi:hypothetical protein